MTPTIPTIVNIVNFLRAVEPRQAMDLVEPVRQQMRLISELHLPATWLLQYDALLDDQYIALLRDLPAEQQEIGIWFEVVQPLVERAGLPWRGRYPWDWHAHVGFSIGYTPEERERLADVFLAEFKATFGAYPRSMGSWLFDAHLLRYLHERYGLVAACNCKDQWGTDGYTLWGGYWNQAYYPSTRNAYMPAQTPEGQIAVPVFRMLGSDPIYQYDTGLYAGTNCTEVAAQGVVTLEPVYCGDGGGGDPRWVRWFFDLTRRGPHLAFGYAQAGQENSFGWPAMARGITDQFHLLAEGMADGTLRVETLADSGAWFRDRYPVTPAASVVALTDWKEQERRSVWYNSRFYRVNLYWEGDRLSLRDIHHFDERYAERYLTDTCRTTNCTYDTLPVMEGFLWSDAQTRAGIVASLPCGDPVVEELDADTLRVTTGPLQLLLSPQQMHLTGPRTPWQLDFTWGTSHSLPITHITAQAIHYAYEGQQYALVCLKGHFKTTADGIAILPYEGEIILTTQSG